MSGVPGDGAMPGTPFHEKVLSVRPEPLRADGVRVLQANLGYRCNLACRHCHVAAGAARDIAVGDHCYGCTAGQGST